MTLIRLTLLAVVVALWPASVARADSFVEHFNGATFDPTLVPFADAGYSESIVSGALDLEKSDGSGTGEVGLRTSFGVGGDFSVTVVAARTNLSGGAQLGLRVFLTPTVAATIFLVGTDTVEGSIGGGTTTQTATATTATLCIRRFNGSTISVEIDTGLGFVPVTQLSDPKLAKVNARRIEMVLSQPSASTAAASGTVDDFTVNADKIASPATPTPMLTPVGPTATPRPSPAALDHFLSYAVKPTKPVDPAMTFVPLGPVTLTDAFVPTGANYDVAKPVALALPADKDGGGVLDDEARLLEYAVKPSKGSVPFTPRVDVRLLNQCNDVTLVVKKPVSLLVPTATDPDNPVDPLVEADHELDHFLCYQAKPEAKLASGGVLPKFPRGIQVDVTDDFDDSETRRYDLKSITKLCVPTDKSGMPFFLKGPAKGTQATITPATRRHPDSLLVCYQAKLATADIPQIGCGPLDPKSKGAKIDPKQPKHAPVSVFVNNQLGPLRLDAVKELELCIPSVTPPT